MRHLFKFYTRLHLTELTGLRASTLGQLLDILKEISDSSIYHHTHRFLQQHQYLSPEPPNDFAYWISDILGEDELGERVASIDTVQFGNIHSLREAIINTIEDYLRGHGLTKLKFARGGDEFHFVKTISFILPTNYVVSDLKEFADILGKISIDSIYYHFFEARLRLGKETNDFSYWIETSIGDKELAGLISRLDPYTRTLEDLRKTLIRMVAMRISD